MERTKRTYRRILMHLAVAIGVGTASIAGVALAGDNGTTKTPPTSTSSGGAPTDISTAAHNALEALVQQGTISQSQADAVQQEVDAGSVEPSTLVGEGTVTMDQMRAIAHSLDQVKRSFGG